MYAREILKKFKIEGCDLVKTPIERGVKLSCYDEVDKVDSDKVDSTLYKSLVESLNYLICIRRDILCGVGIVGRYIEKSTITHMKAAKATLKLLTTFAYFTLVLVSLIM